MHVKLSQLGPQIPLAGATMGVALGGSLASQRPYSLECRPIFVVED